ncbi:uncharacterized protein [Antedon mediterranea]|uniref:uncharacterized protein n=1 Tax=Antedon mediterranea TaxID=105859 RepID=UPI003AF6FDC5
MSMSSSSLPRLQNLPQWPRLSSMDKSRYPKPFLRDQLQVLPPPTKARELRDNLDLDSSVSDMDQTARLHHLEKSIDFLKHQHEEILRSLHEEIGKLKLENKDLHFKVIMARGNSPPGSDKSNESSRKSLTSAEENVPVIAQAVSLDEFKSRFLEGEQRELRYALQEARNRNLYLQQMLEQAINRRTPNIETGQQTTPPHRGMSHPDPPMPVSTRPLKIQRPTDSSPRSPTLDECEIIIRHLQESNERQNYELTRLKADLKDVLYSHKWTPDAYLLAKAYIAEEDGDTNAEGEGKSPRVALKNHSRKIPDSAFQKDTISLPPLPQTHGNKVAERQRRVEAIKRQKHTQVSF